MVLADTNIWIEFLNGKYPGFGQILGRGDIVMHWIVIGELATGTLPNRAATADIAEEVTLRQRLITALASLTGRERELAILSVAGVLRCDFERLAHEPAARDLCLAQAQIDAALAGQVPDGLSADEAMVGRLARAMTADRTLSDEDYADGVAALGRARLAELTWLVGYYGALALALAVFRPALPESFG